ncbi:hypothetical protein C1645_816406 [Glomus cerebriforme]|uniref:Uncharacterized protein n=1 Tax=Glomus cerebriforme TaxID=658196 RepID=A0A397TFI6_9GLOM|nr:hypothetical protein C1645_816406 [Glomus cerebriforme]
MNNGHLLKHYITGRNGELEALHGHIIHSFFLSCVGTDVLVVQLGYQYNYW